MGSECKGRAKSAAGAGRKVRHLTCGLGGTTPEPGEGVGMSRNEFIVEDAALECFGEPGNRISKFALHPDLYLMPRFLGKKKPADVAGCHEKQGNLGEKSGMDGILQGRHSAILQ